VNVITPPAAGNAEAFLTVLRKSQLIEESKLKEALSSLSEPAASDPKDVAQAFINMGLLTRFQVRLLLQGKWRGFIIAGKYRLLDMIGEGGMGKVYLCEHQRMQRLVALKVLPARTAEDKAARERFDREARAIASLNHPNIVQAYDIDTHDAMHYIVMEFVDGVSLQALVALRGPLTLTRAVNYLGQSAAGLQHGHEMGLVHRDIKPANLLLGRDGVIKILDYGLARFFDNRSDDLTKRQEGNSIIGTADYLAPEQAIDCSEVDVRADLYALGGTAYYLLTGQPPFGKELPTHVKLLSHQSKVPQPLRELRPDLDPAFCEVIRKMLLKKPEERYQEPKDVLLALQLWLNQPVPPPTDDEIPMRDALTTKAIMGNTTAKLGNTSSVSTKARGRSVTIVVDRSQQNLSLQPTKKQLPPWIWAGLGGIVVGILFLVWPQSSPTTATTPTSAAQSTPPGNAEPSPVIIGKGNTLSFNGVITGRMQVEPEATLALNGSPILQHGLYLANGSTLSLAADTKVVVQQGAIDVSGAKLAFMLLATQPPEMLCLIRNETGSAVQGVFQDAQPGQTVRGKEGRWLAKISYEGNIAKNSPHGGQDVVLYQFQKVSP
jgi:serine/threonine protein kinase